MIMGANMKCDKRSLALLSSKRTKSYTQTKAYEAFALPSYESMAIPEAKTEDLQAFPSMPKSSNGFTPGRHLGHDVADVKKAAVLGKSSTMFTTVNNLGYDVVPQMKGTIVEHGSVLKGVHEVSFMTDSTEVPESSNRYRLVDNLGHDMAQAKKTTVPPGSSDMPMHGCHFGHDVAELKQNMLLPKSGDLSTPGYHCGHDVAQSNQTMELPISSNLSTPVHLFGHDVGQLLKPTMAVAKSSDMSRHEHHIGCDVAHQKLSPKSSEMFTSGHYVGHDVVHREIFTSGHAESKLTSLTSTSSHVSTPEHIFGHDMAQLKQTMMEHESTFKEQLLELHRLYQIQRSLMVDWAVHHHHQHPVSSSSLSYNDPGILRENTLLDANLGYKADTTNTTLPSFLGWVDINKPLKEENYTKLPTDTTMRRIVVDLECPAEECEEEIEEQKSFGPVSGDMKAYTTVNESITDNTNCWMEEHYRQVNFLFPRAASTNNSFQESSFVSRETLSPHIPSNFISTSSNRSLSGVKRTFEEEPITHLLGQESSRDTQGTSKLPHWLLKVPLEVEHTDQSHSISPLQCVNTHNTTFGGCATKYSCLNQMESDKFLRQPTWLPPKVHSSSLSSTTQKTFKPDDIFQLPPQASCVNLRSQSPPKGETVSIVSNVKSIHRIDLIDDMNPTKFSFDLNVPSNGLPEEESVVSIPIENTGWHARYDISTSYQDGQERSSTLDGDTFLDCPGKAQNVEFLDSGSDDGSGHSGGVKSSDVSGLTSIDSQVMIAPASISGEQSGGESSPSVKPDNIVGMLCEDACKMAKKNGSESLRLRCSSPVAFTFDLNEESVVVNDVGMLSNGHEVTEAAQLLLWLGSDIQLSAVTKDSDMLGDRERSLKWLTDIIPQEEDYVIPRKDFFSIPEEERYDLDEQGGGMLDPFESAVLMLKPLNFYDMPSDLSMHLAKRCNNLVEEEPNPIPNSRRRSARRGKANKDFQRDVLLSVSCLSRQEVIEDLQIIEGLVKSTRDSINRGDDLFKEEGWESEPIKNIDKPQGIKSCKGVKQDPNALLRVHCSWGDSTRRKRMRRQRSRWSCIPPGVF